LFRVSGSTLPIVDFYMYVTLLKSVSETILQTNSL
jgi:hypothetical protein